MAVCIYMYNVTCNLMTSIYVHVPTLGVTSGGWVLFFLPVKCIAIMF